MFQLRPTAVGTVRCIWRIQPRKYAALLFAREQVGKEPDFFQGGGSFAYNTKTTVVAAVECTS
jgi:hypothetical protein